MDAYGQRVEVDTSVTEWDEKLGVYTLFFSVPRFEIVFFKLVIESYEGLASCRTMEQRRDDEADRAVEVVLAVPDLIDSTRAMLRWLAAAADAVQVASTPELRAELAAALAE